MNLTINRRALLFSSVVLSVLVACSAQGAFDLQITEIWPGNEPGDDLTEDWFEVTNMGDMPWVASVDGDLWFDDDRFNAENADQMFGITTLAAGESAIFVDGEDGSGDNKTQWRQVWTSVLDLPGYRLGSYAGSGLSQEGDGVSIWVKFGMPVVGDLPVDTELYPNAVANGGQSFDVTLGEFSEVGNASGAVATEVLNDMDQPAIGSPSPQVPEPGTSVLVLTCLVGLGCRRRVTT
jgi:hypothetical protein